MTFVKNVFMGMLNGSINAGRKIATDKKDVIEKKIQESDKNKVDEEFPNLNKIFNYLITGDVNKKNIEAKTISDIFSKKVSSTIETGESNIQKNTLNELEEAEDDVKETFKFSEQKEDIIKHFYDYSLLVEGDTAKNIASSSLKSLGDWFKSFIGDKPDPEVTSGKKLLWWGKLILRVASGFFGLIVKVAELVGEVVTNTSLTIVSKISKFAGGPGPFKFVALGAIAGALVGIVGDVLLLVGATPFPGMEQAMELKKWWLTAFHLFASTDPTFKIIKWILTLSSIGFAIYHIQHTLHGLKGHGHSEKEVENKESEKVKPEIPTKPSEEVTGNKPAVA
jgi:hypothetical protein